MKWLIVIILIAVPSLVSAQLMTIALKCEGLKLDSLAHDASGALIKMLGIAEGMEFRAVNSKNKVSKDGERHLSYQQYYRGFPIAHAVVKLHYRGDVLYYINGEFIRNAIGSNTAIKISEAQALEKATRDAAALKYAWDDENRMSWLLEIKDTALIYPSPHAQLWMTIPADDKENSQINLAYKFDVYAIKPLSRQFVYVDAASGEILAKENRIHYATGTADTRYSGEQSIETEVVGGDYRLRDYSRGDGILSKMFRVGSNDYLDDDNDWTTGEYDNSDRDNAALEMHWAGMSSFDYFETVHSRNSYDDAGANILLYFDVDAVNSAENAFWSGTAAVFGRGGSNHDALTSVDIVAHELGHALCEQTCDLIYSNESGAINESLSDIWGACVEDWATTGKETWLLGEDVELRSGHVSSRSLSNPNDEDQPDTYHGTDWYYGTGDYGGVHTNSGVGNYWFYLLSEGGSGTNDNSVTFSVSGIGIADASAIVYRAETIYLTSTSEYADFREYAIQAAQDLFGNCSQEVISTINAWHAVGIGSSYSEIAYLYITDPVVAFATESFYASNKIEATNTVEADATVMYEASTEIWLKPGFFAEDGSAFVARIIPCQDLSSNKEALPADFQKIPKNLPFVVSVFPNPTESRVTISMTNASGSPITASLMDYTGRILKTETYTVPVFQFDLSSLVQGSYILTVTNGTKSHYSIIQKN